VLIVGGGVALEAAGRGRPWPWLERLGDASYSIYLIHPLVLAAFARVFGAPTPWLFVPVAMALAIGSGVAARLLIEKPLLKLLKGTVRPHLPPAKA
jgi:peptidoglycan/LPS O-acetylase OafA/YrhL